MTDKSFIPTDLLGKEATKQLQDTLRKEQSKKLPSLIKEAVSKGDFPFLKHETTTK